MADTNQPAPKATEQVPEAAPQKPAAPQPTVIKGRFVINQEGYALSHETRADKPASTPQSPATNDQE